MMDDLKWFVAWYEDCKGWAVMKGGFRDSWYPNKWEAKQRRDHLNSFNDIQRAVMSKMSEVR